MDFLPPAFAAMSEYDQFVVYQLKPKAGSHKSDKIPLNPKTLKPASPLNPRSWMNAQDAIERAKESGKGVGFVLTTKDPIFCLDLDEALDTTTNEWKPQAREVCTLFDGAAVEVSTSGRGLHVFGSAPPRSHKCRSKGIEFYTKDRFIALTGTHARGDAGKDMTRALDTFIERYGFHDTPQASATADTTFAQTDEDLLKKAFASRSRRSQFGGAANFIDLWNANTDVLAKAYPDPARDYDASAADAALAQHLAYWTNKNKEQMLRLMLRSALVREKWQREDYLPRTIEGACGRQQDRIPHQACPQNSENVSVCQLRSSDIMSVEDQMTYFAGNVYVMDEHRVLVPGGYMLKPEQFRTMYSGHGFIMTNDQAKLSNNAWEAFTESRALNHPKVHSSTFKPQEAPGSILIKEGQKLVNIYHPVVTPRVIGDVNPFLKHLQLLLPDAHDREILLSYMAAIVQYKGVKFQYAPFIQGMEGNGKTFLSHCVAFAIGERYTHWPKAGEMTAKFNDWMYGILFAAVEDIFVADHKLDVMEKLKPMITSTRHEIEPKGGAKVTRDICVNFIINSNHKDGLKKTRDGRRFAPLYTAQQSLKDLELCGMRGNYFRNLFSWFHSGGNTFVNEFLHTYAIPDEYNPAIIDRAPVTSCTEEAIKQGTGRIEQEILEAIEQGEIGFRGGWISSIFFDRLLDRLHASNIINRNKRRTILDELGYTLHPALTNGGRATNNIQPDGGRPRLYIHYGHKNNTLKSAIDVMKQYTKDQAYVEEI